ncbi:metal ABC transporter substrate-binding protein [Desulfosediminicola ganghwensis]|uniref:metal ABC transporter substrate-binding protein n=1 Tax=Desulfosediminicola ganghwensis TaxID=2569540 RepID=UPI0010AD8005|nr:metal ABC transporter substrate-binding protein [Desulfosediminicola ganghwensis]
MAKACTLLLFLFSVLLPVAGYAESRLQVYVVNYPLAYFAERIGGANVEVVFPAPAGIDPAFWLPDKATISGYQNADLIIINGAGYAKWLDNVSLPMLRTIDSSRQFRDKLIETESTVTHSHGPGGEHSHTGIAFTTWLDFFQAVMQAESVYQAFVRKDPANTAEYAANFGSLKEDLQELDRRMTAACAKSDGVPLLGSHPVYQYLARRYELNLEMVMWEPGEEPGAGEWQKLEQLLAHHPAKAMLWEDTPLAESGQRLAELGVESLVFCPCFARPVEGDFLSVMSSNVANIEWSFGVAAE